MKISKMPKRPRLPVLLQFLQPVPLRKLAPCTVAGSILSERISDSVGIYGAPHCLQILRTRRWAINARVEEATRNGLTPMSIKRVTAEGASLVCSVENTK